MRIESLKLTNFRNYDNLSINLNPYINIFIGNNGQGKTNILESIYILSLTKSNRYGNDSDVIKFNEKISKIEGIIRRDDLIRKHEIVISSDKKKLLINNKEIHKSKDYISNFCVISFSPLDLEIIKGSPNIRRNMLNIDISQLDKEYVSYLNEYNSIIKMRNEYLKKLNINGNTDYRYLDILNDKMIEKAVKIYEYRFNYINKINNYISNIFKKITGFTNLIISYENSIGIDCFNEEMIISNYKKKLKRNFNNELMQGVTLIGPHRDDIIFKLNDTDMKLFASQGQQRMAIIALKLSEIMIFKDMIGEYPVLLLDDIFSEIDLKKRNKIIKYLGNDIQTIITTTDIDNIDNSLLENSSVYIVNNNKVTKKGRLNYGRKG